jgi:xylulokinase
MVRAVLEGVAFNDRWLHDAVEHFVKRHLDPVRVIGGGAVSDLWCQIHADVMGRTIERVTEPLHANLRGAAIFAARVLGEVDIEEIHSLVGVDATFTPDAANASTYDKLFAEFPKLYSSQKPMFTHLNRHRGSPQPSRPY